VTVPIPPLQVQDLIVETLRPLSELMEELELELSLRRSQWSHYLRDLDSPHGAEAIRWVNLGEVASVRHGRDFPLALQGRNAGAIPFLKVSDMTRPGNELTLQTAGNYISTSDLADLAVVPTPEGTVLLPRVGAAVATNKKRLVGQPAVFDTSFLGIVPGPGILPRYLLYWMMAIDLVTLSNSGGAVPSVRSSMLASRPFPMRSSAEQQRLIAIHDSFHDLVNDQLAGLPAELNARRQQHAHYRDKLLSFGEVTA
jgi:type I restriction enzyme S subunit